MEETRWVVGLDLPVAIGITKAIGLVRNGLGRIEIIDPGLDLLTGQFLLRLGSWLDLGIGVH